MNYTELSRLVESQGLEILGAFHPTPDDKVPHQAGTLVLLGPKEPGFWALLTDSEEWKDKAPDPVDRWSRNVIGHLACGLGGKALFPFGGAPFLPFFSWALRSGRAWQSPVSLLVHDTAGLMVSYRGALALPEKLALPPKPTQPCADCEKPCLTACQSKALTKDGYDVPKCRAYLETQEGNENMTLGCNVRRSCPSSQSYGRIPAQSAYHMSVFKG